jgi:DNA ligase-associated metallophosphoesterase
MTGLLTVEVGAGTIGLLGDRAAWLPAEGLLLVADVHLGKAQAFRAQGVPVPAGTTADNLRRLDLLVGRLQPRELVFLGDLLHARQARAASVLEAFAQWRAQHAGVSMRLVRGNHDDRAGDPPASWGVEVVDEPFGVGGWALCHHPQAVRGAYVVAGHQHPGVQLRGVADRLRLPCFHLGPEVAVLPAFGAFTGLHPVCRRPGDRVAVCADGEVRLLPG